MTTEQSKPKRPPPDRWDEDLALLLLSAGSVHGMRSTFITSSGAGGLPDTCPYTDQQLGRWIKAGVWQDGQVARVREVFRLWSMLDNESQDLLNHYYVSQSIDWPAGVEVMGTLAGAAVFLSSASKREKLINACTHARQAGYERVRVPNHVQDIIDAAVRRAERSVRRAHRAFCEAREEAAKAWVEKEQAR